MFFCILVGGHRLGSGRRPGVYLFSRSIVLDAGRFARFCRRRRTMPAAAATAALQYRSRPGTRGTKSRIFRRTTAGKSFGERMFGTTFPASRGIRSKYSESSRGTKFRIFRGTTAGKSVGERMSGAAFPGRRGTKSRIFLRAGPAGELNSEYPENGRDIGPDV